MVTTLSTPGATYVRGMVKVAFTSTRPQGALLVSPLIRRAHLQVTAPMREGTLAQVPSTGSADTRVHTTVTTPVARDGVAVTLTLPTASWNTGRNKGDTTTREAPPLELRR